ncbi:MAG TPA: PaaI family thioesterase [Solirubrobacteraceae bacterium]
MSDNGHRTRTFTWQDPMAVAQLGRGHSGMEVLQAVLEGTVGAPPIADLLGMSLVEIGEGRAVFAVEPAEWMYNPIGSVHGGIAATLLDSCMGCAIHTTLPAGVGYATSDLQIRYARGMTVDTGRVIAEGTVVHAGRRLATAEGRLTAEETGKLIAHATTACILIS